MSDKDFASLLESARRNAQQNLELKRAAARKAKHQRDSLETEKEALLKDSESRARRAAESLKAAQPEMARALYELADELRSSSEYIHAEVKGLSGLSLNVAVSYWSVRHGKLMTIPGSELSISVRPTTEERGIELYIGGRTFRGPPPILKTSLRNAVLPQMADFVAKAEIEVEIDLSDDYDQLKA